MTHCQSMLANLLSFPGFLQGRIVPIATLIPLLLIVSACSHEAEPPVSTGVGQHHRTCYTNNQYGRAQDVRVSDVAATSVRVHWTNPNINPFETRVQMLRFFDGQAPRLEKTSWIPGQPGANTFTIDGLNAGGRYVANAGARYVASVSLHWHDALGIRCSSPAITDPFTTTQ